MTRFAAILSLLALGTLGALGALPPRARSAPPVPALAQNPAAPKTAAKPPQPGIDLDESPAPFVPKTPLTEAEQDKLEAATLYSTACSLQLKDETAKALRLFQRAHRADPQALPIVRAIAEACQKLARNAEFRRYAIKGAELGDDEPQLLWQAGDLLVQAGHTADAARMFDRARRALPSKQNPPYIILSVEAGRMYVASGQAAAAADPFAEVMHAVDNPNEYRLNRELQAPFQGEAGVKIYTLFAEAFLAAGKADMAETAFGKAQAIIPDAARQLYQAARLAAARGQHAEAIKKYDEFFASRLDLGPEAFDFYAQSLAALGRSTELISALEKLQSASPDQVSLKLFLARRFLADKQFGKARPLLESIPADAAGRSEALAALVDIYRAERAVEPLLAVLGELVAERQGDPNALGSADLGSAGELSKDARLIEETIAAARQQAERSPQQGPHGPLLAAALLAVDARQFDAANALFDAALARMPPRRGEIMLSWGVGMLAAEQFATAANVFRRAIDERVLPADNPTFHFYLARSLEYDNKTDEALALARQALEIAPSAPRLAALAPWILYHARKYEEAAAGYRELLEKLDDNHDDEVLREELKIARLVLSNIAVHRKDLPQAEAWLEEALDEFPDDVGALNDLGYLWADQNKRLGRALAMLQKAVAAEPDNYAYRDSLGWALHRLGRHAEALAEIERAAADPKPDGVVLDHLGDVFAALGRLPAARDAWTRALAAFDKTDPEQAKLVRAKLDASPDAN